MSTHEELKRADTLIKQEQIDEALAILRPIVLNEPENVDAWWLLANAAVEPAEARESLIQVLRLDPDYANAPKAREMLDRLNEQFPPVQDEIDRFPELRPAAEPAPLEEELFPFETGDPFGEPVAATPPFSDEPFDEMFNAASLEAIDLDEELFEMEEDPFAGLDEDPFALDEPEAPVVVERPQPSRVTFEEPEEPLDVEARAAAEERAARRAGRGGRVLGALIGLLLVAAVVVGLLYFLLPELQPVAEDLAGLTAASLSPEQAAQVDAATTQLNTAALPGQPQETAVVVADGALGRTLYAQACTRPSPMLPQLVESLMRVAADQAASWQGDGAPEAFGVNITRCGSNDTLYRASAPVSDAPEYANLQPGDPRWSDLQGRWN